MHVLLHPLRASQEPTGYRREQEIFAARLAAAERAERAGRVSRLRQALGRFSRVATSPRRAPVAETDRSCPIGA